MEKEFNYQGKITYTHKGNDNRGSWSFYEDGDERFLIIYSCKSNHKEPLRLLLTWEKFVENYLKYKENKLYKIRIQLEPKMKKRFEMQLAAEEL